MKEKRSMQILDSVLSWFLSVFNQLAIMELKDEYPKRSKTQIGV